MSRDLTKTLYARVKKASEEGRGVRLTYEECWELMQDDAFATRAELDADNKVDMDEYDG